MWDPQRPTGDCALKLLTSRDEEGITPCGTAQPTSWQKPWNPSGSIKFWVGPPVENGFYYDVDFGEHTFTDKDIPAVEQKMMELAKAKSPLSGRTCRSGSVGLLHREGDEYKLDLLEGLEDGTITFYTQGGFTDLCREPHIPPASSRLPKSWPSLAPTGRAMKPKSS